MTDHRYDFVLPDRRYLGQDPRSLPFAVEKTVSFVPRHGLCTMCGACEGVCPEDAVVMRFNPCKGIPEPDVDVSRCTDCELCVRICPGFDLDLESHLTPQRRAQTRESRHFGRYIEIFRMRSTNPQFSQNGASGGMVTATVAYLLETGRVDGAIVTTMKEGTWNETEVYVARDAGELAASQKSKYQPNPLDRVLKGVIRGEIREQRLVYVGLPCHVEALRLAQKAFPVLAQRIRYVLSIFCSRVPSLYATEFLIREHGVCPDDVHGIDYRSGDHPGHLTIKTREAPDVPVDHLHWSYWGYAFRQFFYPTRCFMCYDKTGEQADISFGDNWSRLGKEQLGSSSVIARSAEAVDLMEEMFRERRAVITNTLSADDFVAEQDLIRKRLMGNRLWWMRRLGRKTPVYYDRFDVDRSSLLRTFRLVRHVLMAEHHIPPAVMRVYIRLSYGKRQLRERLVRVGNVVRRLGRALRMVAISREPLRPPQDQYRIVVIGGFGWRDIGDEAMPRADILRLRERCRALSIVMLSPDPDYTEEYHRERSVPDLEGMSWAAEMSARTRLKTGARALLFLTGAFAQRLGLRMRLWPNARAVLDELASADLLFNVGGGNLNSVIPTELHKKCIEYLAARIMGLPVVVSGQTIGPLTRPFDKRVARIALNRVNLITLRDKQVSRDRLSEIDVRKPRVLDTGDDALGLPSLTRDEAKRLLQGAVPAAWIDLGSRITVALNLKGSLRVFKGDGRQGELAHEVELFAGIANHLIDSHRAKVILIPTDYCEGVDDRELHREISSRIVDRTMAACVEDELTDVELKALIGLTDLAIGARYHYCVFAAAECVPFLGLASGVYQQTKLSGLAGLLDLGECYVPLDAEFAELEEVLPYVATVIEERARIAGDLRERVPGLVEASATAVDFAVECLRSRRPIT